MNMKTKKITLILFLLLLLSSCGQYRLGDKYLTLDEALKEANSSNDLRSLREQVSSCAPLGMDQEHYDKIDRKLEEIQLKQIEYRQEQERKQAKFKREYELEFKRQYENGYAVLKNEVNEFIKNNRGSLTHKSAMEVNKLVADWKSFIYKLGDLIREADSNAVDHIIHVDISPETWDWTIYKREELAQADDKEKKLFSLENFHQIFGEPLRTQYFSYDHAYCLYYVCKDGTVQIQVEESRLDDGTVDIQKLNIF